jgi:transposase InsO family protein
MKTPVDLPPEISHQVRGPTAVFEYIEGWYNRKRRHPALGYLTPCHFESLFQQ